jgi:hypothetical protein
MPLGSKHGWGTQKDCFILYSLDPLTYFHTSMDSTYAGKYYALVCFHPLIGLGFKLKYSQTKVWNSMGNFKNCVRKN